MTAKTVSERVERELGTIRDIKNISTANNYRQGSVPQSEWLLVARMALEETKLERDGGELH